MNSKKRGGEQNKKGSAIRREDSGGELERRQKW